MSGFCLVKKTSKASQKPSCDTRYLPEITTPHLGLVQHILVKACWGVQVEALLHPRYPLFGGWKVQFTFGWSVPLRDFVAHLGGGRMQLTQKLSTPLQGVIVDDLTIKVGCKRCLPRLDHLPQTSQAISRVFPSASCLGHYEAVLARCAQAVYPIGSVINKEYITASAKKCSCPTLGHHTLLSASCFLAVAAVLCGGCAYQRHVTDVTCIQGTWPHLHHWLLLSEPALDAPTSLALGGSACACATPAVHVHHPDLSGK